MDDSLIAIYICILVVLITLSFLIELFSTAYDNVNLNTIKNKLDNDEYSTKKIEYLISLLERPSKFIYTNKLFLIVFYVAMGYTIFGPLASHWLKQVVDMPHWTFICILVLSSVLVVCVFTEFLPRKIALQHSEIIAISGANFQNVISKAFYPLTWFIMLLTNVILKVFRQDTKVEEQVFSEEDVMSMLEVGQESGAIKEEGKKMINSIFAFDDELAYEIMTPRTDVFLIDINDPSEEYIDQLMELRYSRIPVCEDDTDNIIGILNIKDYLIKARSEGFDNIDIRPILRQAYFVPETKNIDSLFVELQKSRQQIAILIDEYGGFSGIVTMEDIIEEVMGDIDDEYDQEEHVIKKIGDSEYIIDGNVDLDDINEELSINLESETSETISGFIIDILGEIPSDNSRLTIDYKNCRFLIISVKERRIDKLKLTVFNEIKIDEE